MVSIRHTVASILQSARSAAISQGALASRVTSTAGLLCLLTASISFAPHALAQTAPAATASSSSADSQPLQEVTVTGSRIKRTTDFTTATPTTVIDTTAMENAGVVNVGDVLAMTPANISNFTPQTTGMSSFNTGAYIPDLRGLNPFFGSRTLTLIDGQRAVSTNTMDSFDLNFVPQVLVQRIDSVTGGGSAAYGSGAVAGVVNIILDHQLEGGKFNADTYDTHYNDAKENHVSAAYGHGLFDDRIHFVLGAEYSKQDPASCQYSGRSWCSANYGPYQTGTEGTSNLATNSVGRGLTTNVSPYGAFAPAAFSFSSFQYTAFGTPLYAGSPDGLGATPFSSNSSAYGTSAPGGSGEPVNQYDNLITSVKRGVVTGLLSAKITDDINLNVGLNWGQVQAYNPGSTISTALLGSDNPYLSSALGGAANVATFLAGAPSALVSKDYTDQIPESQYSNTTLKQVSFGLDGKVADTSWNWDAHGLYGLTEQVQGSPHEFTVLESSLATDTVAGAGGSPVCRVGTGGLAAIGAAALSAPAAYGGGVGTFGVSTLPTYLQVYNGLSVYDPTNPVSGLTESQTLAYLSSRSGGCQPLNPLGNLPLSEGAANYATGSLSLALRQTMTAFSLNSSGDIWKGIGAGPFSLAVGYDWHQEVVHNDFADCPGAENTLTNSNLTVQQSDCLAVATDFSYQFGNDYGGSTTMNEIYTELNFPLLKDMSFAKSLDLDIAARDSFYTNKALYGVGVTPGQEGTGNLPTWKASLVYEPLEGVRLRGSYSHDSRDPDPRDLYYSQSFVPGSAFGWCYSGIYTGQKSLCTINLLGNVDLKPETSNSTTFGVVLSPPQVPGLQASADWFHVHLTNGINGGNAFVDGANCFNKEQAYCSQMQFNPLSYNAAGQAVAAGTPGAVTGAQAFQQGNVTNVVGENGAAYNGSYFDERGIDFSVSYGVALPGGSTLTARALTTWVGEQVYQNNSGAVPTDILGETGTTPFLGDYQPAARWRGNLYITWNVGSFNLTPNMTWVGQGTIGNYDISCSTADFGNTASLCNWAANGYYAGTAGQTAAQKTAATSASFNALTVLPDGVANHMPAYFLFGLNAAYTFENIPGLKNLTLWGQVNNLLNKAPPFTDAPVSNPAFYDLMGQAYRVGFRMTF